VGSVARRRPMPPLRQNAANSLQDPGDVAPRSMLTFAETRSNRRCRSSPVPRSIGGAVVTSPQAVATVFDPALAHANRNSVVEAALSVVRCQSPSACFGQSRPARTLNPAAFGGGGGWWRRQPVPGILTTTTARSSNDIQNATATGASFSFTKINVHTPAPKTRSRQTNCFPVHSHWFHGKTEYSSTMYEGRRGTTFNRIAGTSGSSGPVQRCLIARVNEESRGDFESRCDRTDRPMVEQARVLVLTAFYRSRKRSPRDVRPALQTFQ